MILLTIIVYGFLVYSIGQIFFDIAERRRVKREKDPFYGMHL